MATEVSFARTFLAILDKHTQKITADHVEDPRNYPASTPYTLPRLSTSKPMSKPSSASKSKPTDTTAASTATESSSEPKVTVTIKSPRNPTLEITLSTPQSIATTSMLDIKTQIYEQTCLPVEKLKILYNKKPVADTKTIRDALSTGGEEVGENGSVEFSLMVMGGAVTAKAAEEALAEKKKAASASAGVETKEVQAPDAVAEADADGDTVMTDQPDKPQVVAEGSGPSGTAVLKTEEFWEDLKGFLQQRIRDEKVAEELVGKFRGAV
ncbi:Cell-cycle control medial ring component [Naviculisporaceae sp. PSN 640]